MGIINHYGHNIDATGESPWCTDCDMPAGPTGLTQVTPSSELPDVNEPSEEEWKSYELSKFTVEELQAEIDGRKTAS